MTASTSTYLALIPSENASKPNFMAAVAALTQPFVDEQNQLIYASTAFNLDTAVGAQLDVVGQWVGISRLVATPISGIFFAFDTAGVGWDQGSWQGLYDPSTGVVSLPDDAYRVLIRAQIASNHWDGTMPSLVALMLTVFAGTGTLVFAQDNQNMTITIGIAGTLPPAIDLALLKGGYIVPRPSGVGVSYLTTSVGGSPLFGFDVSNSYVAGFDTGAWGV